MQSGADLIIIGSGSTAFAAALRATGYGARVLMFEKSVLGGTCINWGCIPSKTLIHAALFNHEAAARRPDRSGERRQRSCLTESGLPGCVNP